MRLRRGVASLDYCCKQSRAFAPLCCWLAGFAGLAPDLLEGLMNNRSPVFCPGCHRLMVLRMRQVEDGQKILTTECFDCGVMFNHSRSLDADEAKIEEEQF